MLQSESGIVNLDDTFIGRALLVGAPQLHSKAAVVGEISWSVNLECWNGGVMSLGFICALFLNSVNAADILAWVGKMAHGRALDFVANKTATDVCQGMLV